LFQGETFLISLGSDFSAERRPIQFSGNDGEAASVWGKLGVSVLTPPFVPHQFSPLPVCSFPPLGTLFPLGDADGLSPKANTKVEGSLPGFPHPAILLFSFSSGKPFVSLVARRFPWTGPFLGL